MTGRLWKRHEAAAIGALAALSLVIAASASTGASGDVALPAPAPGRDGWRELTFPRVARTTTYTPARSGSLETVRAVSECSASALYLPLDDAHVDVRLADTPLLRWRWRIERGLDVVHEREKAGDDFAARVYVMFAFDSAQATIAQRVRHRIGEVLYGRRLPGNAINYVWTSHEPRGASWDNPYAPESKMTSLGAGPLPEWRSEQVDVESDYRTLFAAAPPPLVAVALMTDSDDSCQRATAEFADLGFTPRQSM